MRGAWRYATIRSSCMQSRGVKTTTLTFDCYGTLVQWPETLSALLGAAARRHGASPAKAALLSRFREHHSELLAGPYRPYGDVLAEAQRRALAEWGVVADGDDGDALVGGLRAIPPYPEVPSALAELRQSYRMVIVSNTDDRLIAGTIAGLGVEPDRVITAEQARAYKPSREMWAYLLRHVGCPREEVVHVAAGIPTDIAPAQREGVRAVWVNRGGGDAAEAPAATMIAGLDELAPLLGAR
jgi:2-haloacid dehalogenase